MLAEVEIVKLTLILTTTCLVRSTIHSGRSVPFHRIFILVEGASDKSFMHRK